MKGWGYCTDEPVTDFGDVLGVLVDESGHAVASHISSSRGWSQHDITDHARRAGIEEFMWLGPLGSDDDFEKARIESGLPLCEGCDECEAQR